MKIILITLRADYGGGPLHVDTIINNISSDFEVYLACPNDQPYFNRWQNKKIVNKIYELPHRNFSIKKLFGLNRFIQENQISIIHSHGKGAGIYSRLLKLLNPTLKVIHTLHGFHIAKYGIIQKRIYILIEKFLALWTDKFINVSVGEKQICLDFRIFNNLKSQVVFNGIRQTNFIKNAKDKIHLQDKIVITTISRFDYQKNMFLAYEIAKKFKHQSNIIFIWLGDGDEKNILEKKAKNESLNILFTGFTEDVAFYLSATDLYLSTSRWEGLPYALIEAQALGLPIVATNVVGNNEVVLHKENGYLFDDLEDAVKYINQLISNDSLYHKFSLNAKHNFTDKFELQTMMHNIQNIYMEFK